MIDSCGRTINYLRVSVTDRCNLRCTYCMPEAGIVPVAHDAILRFEEILRIVGIMAGLGISRVRLTGGEPLVRKGIADLAASIKAIPGIEFLGLTTNGTLLGEHAQALKDAGVDGLNISLDTVDPARYREITRRGELADVLNGLETALNLGFSSIKLNCVLSPTSTPEDYLGVVGLTRDMPLDVRLIEWMPMRGEGDPATSAEDAMAHIAARYGPPEALPHQGGAGPAEYRQLPGFRGRIGLIEPMSHSFCASCNRLRLTSTGNLKLCLFYDAGIDLSAMLRRGATDGEISAAIEDAVAHKPSRHQSWRMASEDASSPLIAPSGGMYDVGG